MDVATAGVSASSRIELLGAGTCDGFDPCVNAHGWDAVEDDRGPDRHQSVRRDSVGPDAVSGLLGRAWYRALASADGYCDCRHGSSLRCFSVLLRHSQGALRSGLLSL